MVGSIGQAVLCIGKKLGNSEDDEWESSQYIAKGAFHSSAEVGCTDLSICPQAYLTAHLFARHLKIWSAGVVISRLVGCEILFGKQ